MKYLSVAIAMVLLISGEVGLAQTTEQILADTIISEDICLNPGLLNPSHPNSHEAQVVCLTGGIRRIPRVTAKEAIISACKKHAFGAKHCMYHALSFVRRYGVPQSNPVQLAKYTIGLLLNIPEDDASDPKYFRKGPAVDTYSYYLSALENNEFQNQVNLIGSSSNALSRLTNCTTSVDLTAKLSEFTTYSEAPRFVTAVDCIKQVLKELIQ
jgi:hypothetical protein